MKNKENKAGLFLVIGIVIFVLIVILPMKFFDLNTKNKLLYFVLFLCYLPFSFWLGSFIKHKTNKLIKILIYSFIAPMIVIYFILQFAYPFIVIVINFSFYIVISFFPALLIGLFNKFKIMNISYEEFMFLALTTGTILSILFNKYILEIILKYSPVFFKKRDRKDIVELKELTKYVFNPNNIRFIIYLLYFLFIFFFSLAYLKSEVVLKSKLLDDATLQAFLVFLAYDSIRVNSKDLKLLPSFILSRIWNVFDYDKTENTDVIKQEEENIKNDKI